MRVFIDLGAYNGDTIEIAINNLKDRDFYYGFEPFEKSYQQMKEKFAGNPKVILYNEAASTKDEFSKLYLKPTEDVGHSLDATKINVCSEYINVKKNDFSKFISNNFVDGDDVFLKINIEGEEYPLLEKMIAEGTIHYIKKIVCEWHYLKINIDKNRHLKLIGKLRTLGFDLTGKNDHDDFFAFLKKRI